METLLIDDNSTSVFLTEMLLKREGFSDKIRSFLAAEEALTYLEQGLPVRVPEVIFLDLNMPVMDGWDFLEALKPHEGELSSRCRIYVLTSSLAPSDAARAKEYTLVSGLIHKPVDSQMLQVIRAEMSEQDGA
ncbi:response regulator [Hymenobacter tibetensis]|uniref:Response regulator n=1 Tax=Hymenobacter tibetensis TaxID=497967 RepID=A0ABY4CXI6_9BACT|nr:response regulator [Hymenobacter tibetensis]UOG74472.1 response regulator [Hymenobacter tibetensis]